MGNTITYKSSDFIYLPKYRSYQLILNGKIYYLKKKDDLNTFFLNNNEIFVNFFEDKFRYFEMRNDKLCNILKKSDPSFQENLGDFLDFVRDYKILNENETANLVLIKNIMSENTKYKTSKDRTPEKDKDKKSEYGKIDGLLKEFTEILMKKLTKKDGQRSKRRSKRHSKRHSKRQSKRHSKRHSKN